MTSAAPDYFGGGAWCYYPDSLLIRAPLELAELQAFRFPDLSSAPGNQSARELFASMPGASKYLFARYKHELDHLIRLLSTSLGLFVHQLDSQLPDQFRWILSQTVQEHFDGDQPLLLDKDLTEEELVSTATERHAAVRLWHRTDSLWRALLDADLSDAQFIAAMTLLNTFREGQEIIEVEAAWPPTPRFATGTPPTITGRNILEFFAVLVELDYGAILADTGQAWRDLMQQTDYNAVTLLWNGAFPHSSLWDIDPTARLDRDVALFVRHAYPLELYASLNLALWPPLVPQGVHIKRSGLNWKDFHPGHRFIRICEWLQQSKRALTRIGGEDRNDRFRSFQEEACRECGWPSVEELLPLWRADNQLKLDGKPRSTSHLMRISLEQAGHPRLHMTERLLAARLQAPCDFVVGNISGAQLDVKQLGLVTRGLDGRLTVSDGTEHTGELKPRLLRSLIMSGRFLLRGRRYAGDHPAHFQSAVFEEALVAYRWLVKDVSPQFEPWANRLVST